MKHFIIPFLIVLVGCSKPESVEFELSQVPESNLELIFAVNEESGIMLGTPFTVKTNKNGDVFILDSAAGEIVVMDKDGEFITKIGRKGNGPGEFNFLFSLEVDHRGYLFAYDNSSRRMSKFHDAEGYQFIRSFQIPLYDGMFPSRIKYVGSDTTIVQYTTFISGGESSDEVMDRVVGIDIDGNIATDVIAEVGRTQMAYIEAGDRRMNVVIPFGKFTLLESTSNGYFLLNWSAESEFDKYSISGEFIERIGNQIEPYPVTRAQRDSTIASLGQSRAGLANMIPDFQPMIHEFFVSLNGDIWQWIGVREKFEWLVMDENGSPIRRVKAPEGVRFTHADDNRVYGTNIEETTALVYTFN
jgi:hypothetical protein